MLATGPDGELEEVTAGGVIVIRGSSQFRLSELVVGRAGKGSILVDMVGRGGRRAVAGGSIFVRQ